MKWFPKWHKQAKMKFDNWYWVSIIYGSSFYSNGKDTYELAVLYKWDLCYDSGITEDVIWRISQDEVWELLNKIANLPTPWLS